jgi:hypothetical protein
MARAHWLAEREKALLPVPYFHVVLTLPQQIGCLALQNPRQIYSILFRAVSETLLTIAADPKRLGAAIGFLAVLHTWGQNLQVLSWGPSLSLPVSSVPQDSALVRSPATSNMRLLMML